MKKSPPSPEPHRKKIAALPAANGRERNRLIGSRGAGARDCIRTNSAAHARPATSAVRTSSAPQPAVLARTSPHTSRNEAAVTKTTPRGSTGARGPCCSSTRARAMAMIATASGRLSQKIHGHEIPCTTAPPSGGPNATAAPAAAAKTPRARGRSRGSNAPVSSPSASGITKAAPAPCNARAAISTPALGATAHATDAAPNSPTPSVNIRLRPYRSPSAAALISSTAKLSVYALTVHSSELSEAPSSCLIVGSAVVTTRASKPTKNDAPAATTRTHLCLACSIPITSKSCVLEALTPQRSPRGRAPFRSALVSNRTMTTPMTTALLERASSGDEVAFRELTDPLRGELEFHCYRMLGSRQDAEDVLQETMLAAWRSLGSFERRSSLRTWLYRIATNRCLNALRDATRRPPASPAAPFPIPEPTRTADPHWLEPYPDDRLGWLADTTPGPAARYEAREAVEITFIAALQHLSGRQRAVLVLRDVLGFPAEDTAVILGATIDAVKSALKRARAALAHELPERLDPPAPQSAEEKELLGRFVEAFLADDVDGMVALVSEHAWFRMPPASSEYQGKTQVHAILTALFDYRVGQPSRLVETRANGQPAYGVYRIDPASGLARPTGLLLLSLTGRRIAAITWFVGSAPQAASGLPSDTSLSELVSETL